MTAIPRIHKELVRYGLHNLARLEYGRLEYGRLMWGKPKNRERLLRHWNDPRHPYRDRFQKHRKNVERILTADPALDDLLDQELAAEGASLRTVIREIPPVFGSFYKDSAQPEPPEETKFQTNR